MPPEPLEILDADPFDLPEWLGTEPVTWSSSVGLRSSHLVPGQLSAPGHPDVACDLLAVDEAYPSPVVDDDVRTRSHQAWQHGQVLLGTLEGRSVLLVPGTRFGPDEVLDALDRLARAVGADPAGYAVLLRLGVQPIHAGGAG